MPKECVPDFYNLFQCLADKCSDTCCAGWEIDIDENTLQTYKNITGAFGERLIQNIEEGHFKLSAQERCPFLNSNNLCDIYRELGENSLCAICREHPRFIEVVGDYTERGLGLCCEEVVRLLFENEEPLSFFYKDVQNNTEQNLATETKDKGISTSTFCSTEMPNETIEEERQFLSFILKSRQHIFSILEARAEDSISIRAARALHYAVHCFEDESETSLKTKPSDSDLANHAPTILKTWISLLTKTESLGDEWEKALHKIQLSFDKNFKCSHLSNTHFNKNQKTLSLTNHESERLIVYCIYRYFIKSFFDEDFISKIKFALFFWIIVSLFTQELSDTPQESATNRQSICIKAVKLLSKQLEYSDDNMDLLFKHFQTDKFFSTESFICLMNYYF